MGLQPVSRLSCPDYFGNAQCSPSLVSADDVTLHGVNRYVRTINTSENQIGLKSYFRLFT